MFRAWVFKGDVIGLLVYLMDQCVLVCYDLLMCLWWCLFDSTFVLDLTAAFQ